MTPYHYSAIRCRDADLRGEYRNVGLLVMSPTLRRAELRRGDLKQRAHLIGDDADFVRAMLKSLLEEAKEVVRDGDASLVHDWLASKSRTSEDAITFAAPAVGIADDFKKEVARLRTLFLGKQGGGSSTASASVRDRVLEETKLTARFAPRVFPCGPATWRFAAVTDLPTGPVVIHALDFTQTTSEGVLDAAFKNVGRASELRHFHEGTQCVTVASGPSSGPTGKAYNRALHLMDNAGLRVVGASADTLRAELVDLGLIDAERASTASSAG